MVFQIDWATNFAIRRGIDSGEAMTAEVVG
jgi:hypothetical protein